MNFTDLFIRRPVLAMVVNLLIIIAGLQAIRTLNVRQYPRSENATVTVTTVYIGASANLVRGFITSPLERAIAAADGIEYMESKSTLGLSTISVRLRLNYDSTKALAEISSKVDQVRRDLPPEAEVPVINIESADSRFASAYLSFSSDILQQNEITDYLVRVVQPRLSALPGVQRADILGARTFAMRLWLKPDRMAAFNISPAQVRQALAANNFLAALGRSKGEFIQVDLTADTNLSTVGEFRQLVVRERNGTVVRMSDIADVVLGAEDYDAEVHFSGKTATFMGIWPLPNANSLDVIKRVNTEMESIRRGLPSGLDARVAYDATNYISNAIREVLKTLGDTLLIVMLVIYLFLGSFRSVLIPVVAIPLSLIGSVFLMQVFGFTVNLLTLLAIAFYVFVYTILLKRTTTQNIVIGGAAGALPPVIGWAAVTGRVDVTALLLFALVFYWTPPHFWALSLRIAKDYAAAGVPMLPVVRGSAETTRQIFLYTILLVAISLIFFAVAEMGLIYLAAAVVMGALFLWRAGRLARTVGVEGTTAGAIGLYKFSISYLTVLFAAVAVDAVVLIRVV